MSEEQDILDLLASVTAEVKLEPPSPPHFHSLHDDHPSSYHEELIQHSLLTFATEASGFCFKRDPLELKQESCAKSERSESDNDTIIEPCDDAQDTTIDTTQHTTIEPSDDTQETTLDSTQDTTIEPSNDARDIIIEPSYEREATTMEPRGPTQNTAEDESRHITHVDLVTKFRLKRCFVTLQRVRPSSCRALPTSSSCKRHTCDKCGRSYKEARYLGNHRRSDCTPTAQNTCGCEHCGSCFSNKTYLKQHIKEHHLKKLDTEGIRRKHIKCKHCDKFCVSERGVSVHMWKTHPEIKTEDPEFKCKICCKLYQSESGLRFHMRLHGSKQLNFKCSHCGASYPNQQRLSYHLNRDHGESRVAEFRCEECGKSYRSSEFLRRHKHWHRLERTTTNRAEFHCEHCDRVLKTRSHMILHIETHVTPTSERFTCNECGMTFKARRYIQRHVKKPHPTVRPAATATQPNPYKCDICHKPLPSRSKLYVHIQSHLSAFHCKVCGKSYANNTNLKAHMLVHTGQQDYHCVACDKYYARSFCYKQHMLMHTKPFKCTSCEEAFGRKQDLKTHIILSHVDKRDLHEHCVTCPLCGNSYMKHKYQIHLRSHNKDHKCDVCGKSFAGKFKIKRHMEVWHSTNVRFKCRVCEETFDTDSKRTTHLKTMHKDTIRIYARSGETFESRLNS